jgi:secreted trypsin-like serine protease
VDAGVKKQIGVVSYGRESCQTGIPQAYARVTSFLTWINQKTGIAISP